jgi:NAD dependent epimerase/dehydratase family enzyme
MKKTVFITGSTGLLGASILPKLKKEFNIIQLSNNSKTKHGNIKYLYILTFF